MICLVWEGGEISLPSTGPCHFQLVGNTALLSLSTPSLFINECEFLISKTSVTVAHDLHFQNATGPHSLIAFGNLLVHGMLLVEEATLMRMEGSSSVLNATSVSLNANQTQLEGTIVASDEVVFGDGVVAGDLTVDSGSYITVHSMEAASDESTVLLQAEGSITTRSLVRWGVGPGA